MKNVFAHVLNKCKHHTNRMFYTSTNNNLILHFKTLYGALTALDKYITNKLKNVDPFNDAKIVVISENILFKSILFLYCFLTGSKLLMISPKFSLDEIVNSILSRRDINVLFVDKEILSAIEQLEELEGINILQFFGNIETIMKMLEIMGEQKYVKNSQFINLFKRGRTILTNDPNRSVSILSPGTSTSSGIVNIPYRLLGKSMVALSHFMGLKITDKVSVIADMEFYPGVYNILGLLNGTQYILAETDATLTSGEELKEMFNNSEHKPTVLFISSNNFKVIWDTILFNVLSNKIWFAFSKWYLTKPIVTFRLNAELRSIVGEQVTKIHILNEELGCNVLDILKHSKIMFSSSYGFLEEGNFLAFKDPELFSHKEFIYKSGGTLLKTTNELYDKIYIDGSKGNGFITSTNLTVGEVCLEEHNRLIRSEDLGMFIKNVPNQGDRHYLFIYGKKRRHEDDLREITEPWLTSLDLFEKTLKDNWLIRDCFLQRNWDKDYKNPVYNLYVEIREDLLDSRHMTWDNVREIIHTMATELDKTSMIRLSNFAILKFNGMRNVVDKLQYYTL